MRSVIWIFETRKIKETEQVQISATKWRQDIGSDIDKIWCYFERWFAFLRETVFNCQPPENRANIKKKNMSLPGWSKHQLNLEISESIKGHMSNEGSQEIKETDFSRLKNKVDEQ